MISYGKKELLNELGIKSKKHISSNQSKVKKYIFSIYFISIILSLLIGGFIYYSSRNIILSVIMSLCIFIPISEIVGQLVNYILNKKIKPTLIPKLDYRNRCTKRKHNFCSNSYNCKFCKQS